MSEADELYAEASRLHAATRGVCSEFLDAHVLIGVRAGSAGIIYIQSPGNRDQTLLLENEILALAASIVKGRLGTP